MTLKYLRAFQYDFLPWHLRDCHCIIQMNREIIHGLRFFYCTCKIKAQLRQSHSSYSVPATLLGCCGIVFKDQLPSFMLFLHF